MCVRGGGLSPWVSGHHPLCCASNQQSRQACVFIRLFGMGLLFATYKQGENLKTTIPHTPKTDRSYMHARTQNMGPVSLERQRKKCSELSYQIVWNLFFLETKLNIESCACSSQV